MPTLRLSLMGTVILMLLGSMSLVTVAQDETSPAPTATPRPVGEVCEPVELPYDPEDIRLSGVWSGSNGTVAYVSQVGSRIYLLHQPGRDEAPERLGRFWTAIAIGTLADDGTMTLDYGVVPRGEWMFDDFMTITGRVEGEPGEPTRFSLHYPENLPVRPELTYFLTPCAPRTMTTTGFEPAFTFRDVARVGLSLGGQYGLAWIPASDHEGVESGIAVWSITPTSARTCEGPDQPIEPGAEAFLAWLTSREDIVASEPVDVTVDGRPATLVDLTPAPGATACLEDGTKLRLWTVGGVDSAVFTDSMARIILMDVGDSTLAIQMYGDDQETWLPLAQEVVDTIRFTE